MVYPAGAFSRVYAYDPIADTWTTKSPMPIGLYYLTAHAVGDRIYVIGGYDQHGFNPAVLAYDPASDSWSSRSSRPAYSYVFMSTVAGGRIFVIGGQGTIDNGPWASGKPWVYENRVDIYDPVTDTWSAGSPAPVPLAEGVACAAGDRVYVFGKAVGSEPGSFAYAYDIVARDWSKVTPPGLPRRGHACVEVNGDFYLLGGNSDAVPADGLEKVEIYSPQADAWRKGDAMPSARYWIAASSVGRDLFAFGGVGTDGKVVDTVEMLDLSHPR
jgi:N-acetylneuraminic acid mutarotase